MKFRIYILIALSIISSSSASASASDWLSLMRSGECDRALSVYAPSSDWSLIDNYNIVSSYAHCYSNINGENRFLEISKSYEDIFFSQAQSEKSARFIFTTALYPAVESSILKKIEPEFNYKDSGVNCLMKLHAISVFKDNSFDLGRIGSCGVSLFDAADHDLAIRLIESVVRYNGLEITR